MGDIVWAAATGHTGGMLRSKGTGDDFNRAQRVYDAFGYLRRLLAERAVDVIVVIATDHFMTFPPKLMPSFALGTGDQFDTWGEGGTRTTHFKGNDAFSEYMLRYLVEHDIDVMRARNMRLDHAFACPLEFLRPEDDIPVLPVFVNCCVEPLPSFARCREFGRVLGQGLRAQGLVDRIAIVGTGGISHWLGLPRTGDINEQFDRQFMGIFESGNLDEIAGWDSEWVISEAGNGASEIRNWIVAAAAVGELPGRHLAYEPVGAWKTGIGLVELNLP